WVGLILVGLLVALLLALASWSVDDPSLSYATDRAPANWLGFPGAVAADLAFQVLGLGAVLMLLPPAIWSWGFMRRRVPQGMPWRLAAWVLATVLATGVLAFLPRPDTWPLPTGLGGICGMLFASLAAMVTGEDPQKITGTLFAIILAAPTLALLWVALGLRAIAMPARTGRGAGRE